VVSSLLGLGTAKSQVLRRVVGVMDGYGDGTKRDLHDRVAVSLEAIACCLTFGSDYFIL